MDGKAGSIVRDARHLRVPNDRQSKLRGIGAEIGDHLVPRGIAVRVAREGQARQGRKPCRREERQAIVVLRPRSARCGSSVQDQERLTRPLQRVAGSKARLARADHDGIQRSFMWPRSDHRVSSIMSGVSRSERPTGEHAGLPSGQLNAVLAELGWITKEGHGLLVTAHGQALGGVQQVHPQSRFPFVVWPPTIRENRSLQATVASVRGESVA